MKIRNGFVSNSSSSSFIIAGINISKEQYDKFYKEYESNNYEFKDSDLNLYSGNDGDYGFKEGEYVLGEILSIFDIGHNELDEIEMKDLLEIKEIIKTKFDINTEIKLFIGICMS